MDPEQLRILEQWSNQLRLTTDELQEFQVSLKVLGPAFAKVIDPVGKLGEQMKAASTEVQKKAAAEKAGTTATSENTKAKQQNKYVTEALTEAQEELEESTSSLKSAMGSLGKGIGSVAAKLGDALLSSTEGAGKYGDAVSKAGDAALDIGSKFGILGTVIGGLIKAGTMVVEMQLKQADEQRKAIVELSKLGASGQFTSKQMIELSQAAEIPIARFNELLGPLKSMGTAITAIGDNAKQSTENFAKLQNVGEKTREAFFKLGVSAPELTQSFADYISLQKASGRVIKQQEIDNGNLQKAALRYTLQMQELSDLTGLSIEQAKKQMQETQNTIQMAVINFERGEKLAALEERKRNATGEELAQIEKTIALHKKQDEALEAVNKTMAGIGGGGKEAGAAMQQFLSGGGISEEAGRKFTQLGINLNKYREQFEQGTFDQSQFMEEYRDAIANRLKSAGQGIVNAGAEAEKLAKELGVSQEEILWAQANRTKDFAEEEKKRQDQTAAVLAGEVEDPMTDNLARMAETERQTQLAKEKAIDATNILNEVTLPKFTTAAEAMTEALQKITVALGALLAVTGIGGMIKGAKAAAKAWDKAKDWFGKGKPPVTPPTAPTPTPPTPVGKDGKPLRGAALKSAQDKAARIAAEEAAKKAATTTAATAAKTATTAAAPAATAAAQGTGVLGKAGAALGKFGKFIPGVGLALTAGMAAKGAYDAATDVEGTLGGLREGQKATAGQRVAAGAAGALSSLSFGLVDAKTIGGFLNQKLGLGESEKDQADRIAKETAELKELNKDDKILDSLINDLKGTSEPLDKFGTQLDKAKDPVLDFSEAMKKANESLSKTSFGGGAGLPDLGSPFTTQFTRGANPYDIKALAKMQTPTTSLKGGTGASMSPAGSADAGGGAPAISRPPTPSGTTGSQGFISQVASLFGFGGSDAASGDSSAGAEWTGDTNSTQLNFADRKKKGGMGGTMSEQDIKNMIIQHEGIRYEPYKDSLGLWTVGVGHLIGDGRSLPPQYNRKFSHEEVMAMFEKDYEKHKKQAQANVPGFAKYDSLGQAAFIDLTFNMGPGWPRKFKNTSKKIEEGDTDGAARGLENSLWYRQVASRGPTIVNMVENAKVMAKDGGIASGPTTGYPATLHGNEIIVPLDPNSLLAELGKKSATQITNEMQTIQSSIGMSKESSAIPDILRQNQSMIEMLADKLDNVIKHLDTSNDTQSKLLRYSQS